MRRDHFGAGCSERRGYERLERGLRRPVPTHVQMRSRVSLEYLRSFGLFGLWQLWQSAGSCRAAIESAFDARQCTRTQGKIRNRGWPTTRSRCFLYAPSGQPTQASRQASERLA